MSSGRGLRVGSWAAGDERKGQWGMAARAGVVIGEVPDGITRRLVMMLRLFVRSAANRARRDLDSGTAVACTKYAQCGRSVLTGSTDHAHSDDPHAY